ncbi:MAG TPA: hypothetical protein PKZ97_05390 [Azospirillaceae bacterium]|nr:hypothetical protein [Azospirillaceae bacterium]HRQ80532.1 hypothetical protein [Azospirillaceae bacterium]
MARNVKKSRGDAGYTLFNITYQDGAQSSNRKLVHADVDDIDNESAVRAYFEAQDRKIAKMSGNPRGPIKVLVKTSK